MTLSPLIAVGSYPDWDLRAMREAYDLHQLAAPGDIATLPEALRNAARAIAYKTHAVLDGAAMDLLPALGIVANYGVGYDAIDIGAARARAVRVTNTPDVLSDDVADLAAAMLVAQARDIVPAANYVKSGRWARDGAVPLARRASGRRAGIVGLGRIGRAIADRLAAFNMEIHYHSRAPKDVPANWRFHSDPVALAAAVDYLVVALVGGPETEKYVTAEALDALGPDGVIVNISRGSTIDEAAMLDALSAGRLGGAALDVFNDEPAIDPRFLTLDTVLALPHIGSATVETRKAMGALQRENLQAFFAGNPLPTEVL